MTPAAGAVIIHHEIDREILDEKLGLVLERLLVEGVKDGMTGTVGGGGGSLRRGPSPYSVVMPPNGR